MSRKLTLAEQLAEIAEPTPQDVDPEDAYSHGFSSSKRDREAEMAAQSEYAQVDKSELRKRAEFDMGDKYKGKKASRQQLEQDQESASLPSEDDLESDEQDVNQDSDEDAEGDQEDDVEEDDDEEEERIVQVRKDDRAMLSQLRTAASADVQKGIDVKKQLAFCDRILEARIKLQKAVAAANTLPVGQLARETSDELEDDVAATVAEVEALNDQLFEFRHKLMQSESLSPPALPRKRPFSSTDMASLEQALDPFLRSTITKWSDKVAAASGLSSAKAKFKAINTNVLVNIDQMLSNSTEKERLVKRTRTRRNGSNRLGRTDGPLEGEKDVDVECFDDGDFYAQLLRDVVESRSSDLVDQDPAALAALRAASARSKKNKKIVDTRASKGRKIRYDVHEKIQNFMIPIPAGSWHDEQIDELFAGLLGRANKAIAQDAQQQTGTLRIFG